MSLERNLKHVLENIENEKEKSSFNQNVELIAVTKTRPLSTIEECYKLGITNIGENRVQEAVEKFSHFDGFERIKKGLLGTYKQTK